MSSHSHGSVSPGTSLFVEGQSVIWSKNGILVRKFSFPDPVICAEFIRFNNTDSVAILLSTNIFIYPSSGSVYIVSLPFLVSSIIASPFGLVLSRDFSLSDIDTEDQSPKFYLISNPLIDPIPIFTSTLTSVYSTEELVYFGNALDSPFCVTYDQSRNEIFVYHVRIHKPTHIFEHTQKPTRYGASLDSENLMLTSIASFQMETSIPDLNVTSASYEEQTVIAISRKSTNTTHVIVFGIDIINTNVTPVSSFQSSIKPVKSFDLVGTSPIFVTAFESHPILLILHSPSSIYLCDPFLDIKSLIVSLPSHWSNVSKLDLYKDFETLGFVYAIATPPSSQLPTSQSTYYNLHLPLIPKNELTSRVFEGFRKVLDQKLFQCIAFGWTLLLVGGDTNLSEWEALVALIVSQMFPQTAQYFSVHEAYPPQERAKLVSMFSGYKLESHTLDQIIPLAFNVINTFPDNSRLGDELRPHMILIIHYIREELRLHSTYEKDVIKLGYLLTYIETWSGWPFSWTSCYGISPSLSHHPIAISIPPLSSPPNIFNTISSFFSSSAVTGFTSSSSRLVPFPLLSEVYKDQSLDSVIIPQAVRVCKFFALADQDTQFSDFFRSPQISKKFFNSLPTGIQYAMYECLQLVSNLFSSLDDSRKLWDILCRDDLLLSSLNSNITAGTRDIPFISSKDHISSSKDVSSLIGSIGDLESVSAWDKQTESDRNQISRLIFSSDRRFYQVSELLQSSNPRVVTMSISPNMSDAEVMAKQDETFFSSVLRTCTVPLGRSAFYFSSRKPLATEKYPIPRLNFSVILKPRDVTLTLQKDVISEENLSWGYFHNGVSAGLSLSKESQCVNGNWITFNKPRQLNSQHAGFLMGIGLNGHLKYLEEWHIYNYLGPKHSHTSIALLIGMAASHLGSADTKLTKVLSVHIFALLPPGSNDLNVPVEVQTAGVIGMGLLYLESSHRRMTETFLGELEGRTRISTMSVNTINSNMPHGSGSNSFGFFSLDDRIHTNESYKLATGFALGLINLGKGHDLRGLHDIRIVDRLVSRIVNPRDVQTGQLEISIPGSIAALLLMFLKSENNEIAKKLRPPDKIQAYEYIRPDILLLRAATAKLIKWNDIKRRNLNQDDKSNNSNNGEKESDEDIEWANWQQWVDVSIPKAIKQTVPKSVLAGLNDTLPEDPDNTPGTDDPKCARSDLSDGDIYSTDHLPYYYIRCGLCFALSIRYASSCDSEIRDLLIRFLDFVCVITESPTLVSASIDSGGVGLAVGSTHDLQLFRQALLHIQNTLCLAVSIVMCGSGDLAVLKRLRRLSIKTRKDTCGVNMAVSQSLGYLFLGGGQYRFDISPNFSQIPGVVSESNTLDTSNRNIAFLLISNWPVYPRVLVDNASYLQPLRYLWALSAKMCCVTVREVESGEPCDADLIIKVRCDDSNDSMDEELNDQNNEVKYINGTKIKVIKKKAPCLLPSLADVISIETMDERFSNVCIDISSSFAASSTDGRNISPDTAYDDDSVKSDENTDPEDNTLCESFLRDYTIYVTKRRTFLSKATEIIHQASTNPVLTLNEKAVNNTDLNHSSAGSNTLSLLSSLKILKEIDVSSYSKERDLIYRSFEQGILSSTSSTSPSTYGAKQNVTNSGSKNSLLYPLVSSARSPQTNEELWQLKTVFEVKDYSKRKKLIAQVEDSTFETDNGERHPNSKELMIEEDDTVVGEMKALLWKWKMDQQPKQ